MKKRGDKIMSDNIMKPKKGGQLQNDLSEPRWVSLPPPATRAKGQLAQTILSPKQRDFVLNDFVFK
jgi:hypothetical protein